VTTPRTVGGSLLRQALDELQTQIAAAPAAEGPSVTAFVAYDRETGAEVGAAVRWQGAKGHEWMLTGALARKVQASGSPYAVRLELKGKL